MELMTQSLQGAQDVHILARPGLCKVSLAGGSSRSDVRLSVRVTYILRLLGREPRRANARGTSQLLSWASSACDYCVAVLLVRQHR
jgi:hypothetical protein